jgi:nucleoside-diphosphate-sugar epimerase
MDIPPIFPDDSLVIVAGGTGDTGLRLAKQLSRRENVGIWLTSREPSAVDSTPVPVRQWAGAGAADALDDLLTEATCAGYRHIFIYNVIGAWLHNPREGILGVVQALTEAARGARSSIRIIHCGATSVYGDRPGEELTEASRLAPHMAVGRIHAEAEAHLLNPARDFEVVVLRIPHIYGPGRERTVDMMAEGRFAVAGDGLNPMHHIHVDDLVRAMEAAALAPMDGELINVVDDEAWPYGAYCDFITAWYGREPLPRVTLEDALEQNVFARYLGPEFRRKPVVREFYRYMTSRATISNEKMKSSLGIQLRYPLVSDGLESLLSLRDAS